MKKSKIIGTGSYIPQIVLSNADFSYQRFYTANQELIDRPTEEITNKFREITGIEERRYARESLDTSDLGFLAAQEAISNSGIDPETIDQIVFAHNFGDVRKHTKQTDAVPALASRVKHQLKIKNANCVAYDLLFGCPGWIQGLIQMDAFFKAGMAKTALVIGGETLSRVIDSFDRDSMIFADGAGACILRYEEGEQGILASNACSHTLDEAYYLHMSKSNFPESDPRIRYIKMNGRKVYEYALTHVPLAMKECVDKAGVAIHEIKKVFIHQANEKLDEGVIKRFFRLYKIKEIPENIMPMSVHKLGNSSVATVPTLLDRVIKGELENHSIEKGDVVLFASVGAGMNINAICYRV
tara:strand:+ start:743 stop:1807 length:1065 start_codon:yes stop_codon:yes gene_type:complete